MSAPTLETVRAALERMAARRNVVLVWPGDYRREAIVPLVAQAYRVVHSPVTAEDVRERVSVTLPGVPGLALDLLGLLPEVGRLLRGLASGLGHTVVAFSPAACSSPELLAETGSHELSHADAIAAFGLGGCLAYLVSEGRAGREMPPYGQGLVVRCALRPDLDPLAEAESMAKVLPGYGLDVVDVTWATRGLRQVARSILARAPVAGTGLELLRELGL